MLNCRQMAELSTEYLEGKLGFWQRLNYYLHWMVCPPCRAYRDQVEETARTAKLAQASEDQQPPAAAPPAPLLESFREKLGE